MYFAVRWLDPRIYINKTWYEFLTPEATYGGFVPISLQNLEYFWTPDVEIYGVTKYQSQNVLKPMAALRINREGMLRYSTRVNIIISCHMDFKKYPFDSQKCNFPVGSYNYPANVVNCTSKFRYHSNAIQRSIQYSINIVNLPYIVRTYEGSGHDWVNCGFSIELERNNIQMVLQVHIASTALVIVSWFSFVVNPSCVPGRMGMLITVFLVLINIFIGVKNNSPISNGLNAADVFLVTCIGNVFAALLEYAVVLILYEKKEGGITSFGNTMHNQRSMVTPTEDFSTFETSNERTRKEFSKESQKTSATCQWNLIDKLCMFLFPTFFTVFLIVYIDVYVK